jgi:hypothetical protein
VTAYSAFSNGESQFPAVFYAKFSDVNKTIEGEDDWAPALRVADAIDKTLSARPLAPPELGKSVVPGWIEWHASIKSASVRKRYRELAAKIGVRWWSRYKD